MFLLLLLILNASPHTDTLELLLQAVGDEAHAAVVPHVRVLVRNPPDSEQVWYLQRNFWVVPTVIPLEGDLSLRFSVTAPDGRNLKPTVLPMILSRIRTEPEMFLPMRPSELFGVEVDLASLGFDMRAPGSYVVQAILSTQARTWFDDWLKAGGDPKRPVFKRDQLFTDPVYSAPLQLQVVKESVSE